MLFDLKGKRRRTVQITYVGLAFLMAAGLVGAGIGSGTSGGLFDLFGGGSGKSTANNPSAANTRFAARSTLAGQTRKATLAGQQAIKLAKKSQKSAAKQEVKAATASATAAQYCSG